MLQEDGSYFIDRSGDIFRVVLDFLRTGLLVIPKDIPSDVVLHEAEYYALPSLIEAIKASEEQSQNELELEKDLIRTDGYYMNNLAGEKKKVIRFSKNQRLLIFYGTKAEEHMKVIYYTWNIPEIWKDEGAILDEYAQFCDKYLRRGTYTSDAQYLRIKVSLSTPSLPGIILPDEILLPQDWKTNWNTTGFEQFKFVPFCSQLLRGEQR